MHQGFISILSTHLVGMLQNAPHKRNYFIQLCTQFNKLMVLFEAFLIVYLTAAHQYRVATDFEELKSRRYPGDFQEIQRIFQEIFYMELWIKLAEKNLFLTIFF